MNSGLSLLKDKAVLQLPDGSQQTVVKSLDYRKLYFKCTGCGAGVQHFRLATAHTVQQPEKLQCKLCACVAGMAEGPSKGLASSEEVVFVMQLQHTQWWGEVSWQVHPSWWGGCTDLYILTRQVHIQVDGTAHFKSTRGCSVNGIVERDMQCCLKAWVAGDAVIRVHVSDIADLGFLSPAIEFATGKGCIVLSPGYMGHRYRVGEKWLSYADVLQQKLTGCITSYDMSGNQRFHKAEQMV